MTGCRLAHALVTNAEADIGRATALRLAARGVHVFGAVPDGQAADQLRSYGVHRLRPLVLDTSDYRQVAEAAELIAEHADGLKAVVRFGESDLVVRLDVVQTLVRAAHGRVVTVASLDRGRALGDGPREELQGIDTTVIEVRGIRSEEGADIVDLIGRRNSPWTVADAVVRAVETRRLRARYSCGRYALVPGRPDWFARRTPQVPAAGGA